MRYDDMVLCELVRNISNGSAMVEGEDVMGNMLEALCGYLLVRGENRKTFPGYLEASQHRHDILEQSGLRTATAEMRYQCAEKLMSRGQKNT